MRSMLSAFPTELVILHKKTGEVISDIEALVDRDLFHIDDVSAVIEEGDIFERMLPNGAKEYYRVEDSGFFRGDHGISDHYQTKVKKVGENEMLKMSEGEKKQSKVFISHSSDDKEYVTAFVELLEDIGMPDDAIVCTSVPGHGIPGGQKIYDWLREQFQNYELRMIFVLSKNYYDSPTSLNEMGAAWLTKTKDTLMLLPGFDFPDIKGCIDPSEIGIKLDGDEEELRHRLGELKDMLITEYSLSRINVTRWERHRNQFIERIQEISNETLFGIEAKNRFKEIAANLEKSQHWGPVPWEGGQDVHDMLEIRYVSYDPNSMGIEWKDCKQSVRRVYRDDNGEAKVEGWRIK